MENKSITKAGTKYFKQFNDARNIRDSLSDMYKDVRLVKYGLGWAIQYRKSGPYYPKESDIIATVKQKN